MKRIFPVALLLGIASFFFLPKIPILDGGFPLGPPMLLAQGKDWKAEYESVCAKTDMAMTLSVEELKGLIARCDKLKPQIEKEEESTQKVYLRRLHMCRELFQYVLDSKEPK